VNENTIKQEKQIIVLGAYYSNKEGKKSYSAISYTIVENETQNKIGCPFPKMGYSNSKDEKKWINFVNDNKNILYQVINCTCVYEISFSNELRLVDILLDNNEKPAIDFNF